MAESTESAHTEDSLDYSSDGSNHPSYITTPSRLIQHSGQDNLQQGVDPFRLGTDVRSSASYEAARLHENNGAPNQLQTTDGNHIESFSTTVHAPEGTSSRSTEIRSTLPHTPLISGLNENPLPLVGKTKTLAIFNPKVWASMSLLWARFDEKAASEVETHLGLSNSEFIASYNLPHIHSSTQTSSSVETIVKASLDSKELLQFISLLWAINRRTIHILLKVQEGPIYVEQQRHFIGWFINFMSMSKDPSNCSKIRGEFLYQKIVSAWNSEEQPGFYRVLFRKNSESGIPVTPKQMLINEAAVHVLVSYYKATKCADWERSLTNELNFVIVVADLTKKSWGRGRARKLTNGRQYHRKIQKDFTSAEDPMLTRGKGPMTPEQQQLSDRHAEAMSFLDKHVEFIAPIKGGFTNQPRILEPFILGDEFPNPNKWAWLSGMRPVKSLELRLQPRSTSSIILKEYIKEAEKKMNKEAKLTAEELERLLDKRLWLIVGSLYEALDGDIENGQIHQEQESIRAFLDYFLVEGKSERLNFQELQTDKVDELMAALIFLDDNPVVYKMKTGFKAKKYSTPVTQRDLIVTELAVNILGNYFKTQNYEKWFGAFAEDKNFLRYLIKQRYKHFSAGKMLMYRDRTFKIVKSLNLLPWSAKSQISNGNLPQGIQTLFRSCPKLIPRLDTWIIPKPEKEA
ncbi:hypothetical protein PCASD_24340 [Puccinia coronata f. sp. avenae]|uniref:Uncharacterized protein n=1 Tax=Puccinia coronata f. sp. avenae TaxID=200324 RepID=A0A2N5TMN4_9BASI|nr:hypothetical protein PCASD_24340 [Puccinia coronata f. sp. avenae]